MCVLRSKTCGSCVVHVWLMQGSSRARPQGAPTPQRCSMRSLDPFSPPRTFGKRAPGSQAARSRIQVSTWGSTWQDTAAKIVSKLYGFRKMLCCNKNARWVMAPLCRRMRPLPLWNRGSVLHQLVMLRKSPCRPIGFPVRGFHCNLEQPPSTDKERIQKRGQKRVPCRAKKTPAHTKHMSTPKPTPFTPRSMLGGQGWRT